MYLTRYRKRVINSTNKKEEKEPIIEDKKEDIIYCLICWEPEEKDNNPITKMKSINLFIYICDCDCNFHPKCFLEWAAKTHACPICREPLTINMKIYYELTLGNNYKFKLFCKKMGDYIWTVIYYPIRYCFIAWTMYFSLRFLYAIIHFILVIIT